MRWPRQFNLQCRDSTQAIGQSWFVGSRHVGVGNHRHITGQLLFSRPQNTFQIVTPDLLLSLNNKNHIGIGSTRLDFLCDPHHVGKNLAFVVGRPPRHHHSVDDPRLKRIRRPTIPDFGRLDVIMSINQYRPALSTSGFLPLGQNHRSPRRGHNFGVHAHFPELFTQPFCTLLHRLGPGRLGRNGRKSQKFEILRFSLFR